MTTSEDQTTTLHELKKNAVEYLKDGYINSMEENEYYLQDIVHEVADGTVPVYNSEIMEVAQSAPELYQQEPEMPPEENTVLKILQVRIYEEIRQHLYNYLNENPEQKQKFRE